MPVVSLRRGDIIDVRDERWTVVRHATFTSATIVDVCGCERTNRGVRAQFVLPFEPYQRVAPPGGIQVVSGRKWRRAARQALAGATPSYESLRVLARARIDLLPFQLEPALAVTRGVATRLLIADEVGLGKTVQAGLIAAETIERQPDARVLVVTPASLRDQWRGELRDRFQLTAVILDSLEAASAVPGSNPWAANRLIVTSVDYVKRPEAMRSVETLVWDLLIVDEAHGLSGRSDRNAALTLLGGRARTLVLLTATPHSGDETAFARLCGIGDLANRFPLLAFRRTRDDAGLPSTRRTTWLRVGLSQAEAEMHRTLLAYVRRVWAEHRDMSSGARLAMLVLMRRACSSASSLARSVERRLSLLELDVQTADQLVLPLALVSEDDEPAAELAVPGLSNASDERRLLEQIGRLAAAAAQREAKLAALRRLLRRAGEPAIVFTEYRDTLAALEAALQGRTTALLHGGLTGAERRGVLERFRSGAVDVLLATDAASEGLNLHQRCRLVINLELPWTPSRLEQRIGRVDRIGQPRRVHAIHLLAAGTSEETTVAQLVRRIARVETVARAMQPQDATERDIAERVVGGEPGPSAVDTRPQPSLPGLFTTDLRGAATLEVNRALVARRLCGTAAESTRRFRPFVTVARRAGQPSDWAWRLEFADADDTLIWEALIGIRLAGDCSAPRLPPGIRRHAHGSHTALVPLISELQERMRGTLAAGLVGATALATAREEAIVAAAVERHGRLAAALVQRGLFDRRSDRAAAAQDAEFEEMLARCRDRLAQLEKRARPMAAAAEPVFALLRR